MVHAEHSSELVWHNPATDRDETHIGGEPVGFVIELENGLRIYHMGDTAPLRGHAPDRRALHPDVVLVPIGGHFVMDPEAAAFAVRELLKPKFALPMHYGTTPSSKALRKSSRARSATPR